MIDHEHDRINAECDHCGEIESFRNYDFNGVVKRIKELGWIIRFEGGDWHHYCGQICYREAKGND